MKDKFKNIIAIICLIIATTACSPNKESVVEVEPPHKVIPKDSMINILVDMHIAEATIANMQNKTANIKGLTQQIYDSIFNKHKINSAILDSNIYFYSSNPKALEAMYQEVINKITQRQ